MKTLKKAKPGLGMGAKPKPASGLLKKVQRKARPRVALRVGRV